MNLRLPKVFAVLSTATLITNACSNQPPSYTNQYGIRNLSDCATQGIGYPYEDLGGNFRSWGAGIYLRFDEELRGYVGGVHTIYFNGFDLLTDEQKEAMLEKEGDCTQRAMNWIVDSLNAIETVAPGRAIEIMFGDVPLDEREQLVDGLAFFSLSVESQIILLQGSHSKVKPFTFRYPPLTLRDFNQNGHLIDPAKSYMDNLMRQIERLAQAGHLGNHTVFPNLRLHWGIEGAA